MAARQPHINGITRPSGRDARSGAAGFMSPRVGLIFIDAFLALGAIAGGLVLALYPSSGGPMNFDLDYLKGSPFNNYLLPGLFLTGVGVGSAVAAILHLRHATFAAHASFFLGLLIMVFELVEVTLIPFSVLQPVYFAVGLAMVVLATRVERNDSAAILGMRRALDVMGFRFAAVTLVALLGLYAAVIHPWFIDWGATDSEQQMALAGDELNQDATRQITRAVTIDAPAETVWHWLIQHGQDRAGFYSYTWLENLTGADIHNSDELRAEWQDRAVGDTIPMSRAFGGARNDITVLQVAAVEPNELLATLSETGDSEARVLIPIDNSTTRVLFRDREGSGDSSALTDAWRWLVWDPMHFVMQRGMLLGLEARAEGNLHEPEALYYASMIGWLAMAGTVAALFLNERRVRLWLAVPIVVILPALLLAGDIDAALAGFTAAGLATYGGVRWGRRWWPKFAILTAFVLLILLVTADPYIAFGLLFAFALLAATAVALLLVTTKRPVVKLAEEA